MVQTEVGVAVTLKEYSYLTSLVTISVSIVPVCIHP